MLLISTVASFNLLKEIFSLTSSQASSTLLPELFLDALAGNSICDYAGNRFETADMEFARFQPLMVDDWFGY